MSPDNQFDPSLARAATLSASWNTDPARLPPERERIFRRTWQYAASLDPLCFPGNYVAVGVPVVLTRDLNGELRAFYNVCQHRAGVVAHGAGNRKTLECKIRGWL
jgi:phenylpropionate dioxygenase-like ring-hydroxylating dioxygenase large terminal subunit